MSEVSFRGIEKRFDAQSLALRSLDLDVPDGAFLVLLGPSGCGKTTALRVLAGLEIPTAGTVHIGGRDVTRIQPRDRDVAMVFQSYALYPHMTVAENIGYPLRIRGLSKADQRAGVQRVAESLEISHLLDRRPRHLSGGQRQRVALARAIVREPSVFLMDEPLSNLDAKLRTSMRGEIKRLQKRLGTTTLYVTHDQAEAMTMADLVAVMRDGELQQLAPPDELYDRPANRFVAAFVGNPPMNVLEGSATGDGRSFLIGDQALALGGLNAADATALGVRPEDLEILPQGTPGALAGEIYVVEPMGNETLVDVRIGDQRVMARAAREFAAPIGSPIGVRVALKSACFFGPEGTTALHRSDRASKRREMSA
ncbi:MAG TPA: ABC transporter ATP-binding protein [Gaiellales bacterium]|jgi:multiple sugar transport system ATP-binding protein|nr:ABC transporter ATP-binding protein [Gaiellales bacterium]